MSTKDALPRLSDRPSQTQHMSNDGCMADFESSMATYFDNAWHNVSTPSVINLTTAILGALKQDYDVKHIEDEIEHLESDMADIHDQMLHNMIISGHSIPHEPMRMLATKLQPVVGDVAMMPASSDEAPKET